MRVIDNLKLSRPVEGEVLDRGPNSLLLRQPDQKTRLILSNTKLHTATGEGVDTTIRRRGQVFSPTTADYRIEIDVFAPSFRFFGDNGDVEVLLRAPKPSRILAIENRVRYEFGDYEIDILCRPSSVKTVRRLLNANAPRRFEWDVVSNNLDISEAVRGRDADRNRCEVTATYEGGVFTDEWTGRVSKIINPKTRQRGWVDEPSYPVLIDPTVNETITAGGDDVHSISYGGTYTAFRAGNSWMNIGHSGNTDWRAALRYAAVAVPQGTIIDSAILTVMYDGGRPVTMTVFGEDVDDAAAFSYSRNPHDITVKTTASKAVALASGGSYATVTADIKDIVEEVVGRMGWSSGNDLALVLQATGETRRGSIYAYENTLGSSSPVTLDITYTAGGPTLPIFREHYRRRQQ